ncbi:MAG: DegT/DnrJ/EryC1/StrS family aminotransferase [Anaerolineales bacterium]
MSKNTSGSKSIPMSMPDLTEAERKAVMAVLETPRLSMGPQLEAFEQAVADYVGVEHAVAVNSGTAGLHLCVRAAGISDGDLVITTPFSFVASSNVMLYERAVPVFVDVDPLSGNIDPDQVAQAAADLAPGGIGADRWLPRSRAESAGPLKAILAVDVFGQPANYEALEDIAEAFNLALIEDSCEALGARYRGRPAGTFGNAGVFAFYPNKQITTAEGGVVVTDRQDWADVARSLRNQGRDQGDAWLDHSRLGYNYRMTELSAALGVVQMERLETLLQAREKVAGWYQTRLEGVAGVTPPQVLAGTDRMSWFVYVIKLDPGYDQMAVSEGLLAEGVPTRPYFRPIHLQRYFVDRFGYAAGDFPVSEDLGRCSLALPFSGVMAEEQVHLVVDKLIKVLAEQRA